MLHVTIFFVSLFYAVWELSREDKRFLVTQNKSGLIVFGLFCVKLFTDVTLGTNPENIKH